MDLKVLKDPKDLKDPKYLKDLKVPFFGYVFPSFQPALKTLFSTFKISSYLCIFDLQR